MPQRAVLRLGHPRQVVQDLARKLCGHLIRARQHLGRLDGPSGTPIDVLTGFVLENGDAMGRPVGVAIDNRGALLVADDVGNAVWRVTAER